MDANITHEPTTWPTGDKVWNVCRAIAIAEGADVFDEAPDHYNNPGDLSKGDEHGCAVSGYVTLPDGEIEIIFSTKLDGWTALYRKIAHIRDGLSSVYKPSMTWQQIAAKYAGDSKDWAANVARELGIAETDQFGAYFGVPLSALQLEDEA